MIDKTSVFLGDECLNECNDFARKLKDHGLEQFEALQAWQENLGECENEEEELENKEIELTKPLFDFLLVDHTVEEEIQMALTEVEDMVLANVSGRDN